MIRRVRFWMRVVRGGERGREVKGEKEEQQEGQVEGSVGSR